MMGWKKATKKGRSNDVLQPFRVSLFERFYDRLRVCLKTFDKRGREVDNKGKTGGR